MKIRTKYYCEYCGKEFETETSCQAHEEKTHVFELNIVNKNYVAGREFPNIIKITTPTKENQVAVYEFLRIDDAI